MDGDKVLGHCGDTSHSSEVKWKNPKITKQIQYALISSIANITIGATITYPGILLARLREPDSGIDLTMKEEQLFASIAQLASIPASFLSGTLQEIIGPKKVALLCLPVLAMTFGVMSYCVYHPPLLILLRVIQGMLQAFVNTSLFVYICEITDEHRRGIMGSVFISFFPVGVLFVYTSIGLLPWNYVGYIIAVLPLSATIGLYICPESYLWLVRKGRMLEAHETAMTIRCDETKIKSELQLEQTRAAERGNIGLINRLKSLRTPKYLLPCLVSLALQVFKEAAGNSAFNLFSFQIFQEVNTKVSPLVSSIIIAFTRLVCNLIAIVLIAHTPRRLVLGFAASVGSLATATLGVYSYLRSADYGIDIYWLPVLCVMIYMICFGLGTAPICFIMSSELIPTPARNVGGGISMLGYYLVDWLISFTFEPLRHHYGLYTNLFAYSTGSFLLATVAFVILPETKGKSLLEIEEYWESVVSKYKRCCQGS